MGIIYKKVSSKKNPESDNSLFEIAKKLALAYVEMAYKEQMKECDCIECQDKFDKVTKQVEATEVKNLIFFAEIESEDKLGITGGHVGDLTKLLAKGLAEIQFLNKEFAGMVANHLGELILEGKLRRRFEDGN